MAFLKKGKTRKLLSELETRIGTGLPDELVTILETTESLEVGPCRFSTAESLAALLGRVTGWPPELIPFGMAGPDSFCLMRMDDRPSGAWPVVLGIVEPPSVVPIASTFRGFLFFLGLHWQDSASHGREGELAKKTITDLGVPRAVLETVYAPGQLPEEQLRYDPGALVPRCVMACREMYRGDPTAVARKLIAVAQVAPWWGAPHYLLGRLYKHVGHTQNAAGCHWNAIERANCWSGFTSRPNLGDLGIGARAEAEAMAHVRDRADELPEQITRQPRWAWMSNGVDPNDAQARLALARRFITAEQWDRAIWALLDAVQVARKDPDLAQVALGDLESVYYTLGRPFEAQMCHA